MDAIDPKKVLEPLRAIHPDDGGYITFHGPRGDNPIGFIGALKPTDLGGLFPELITSLTRDAYFTINGMHQPWRNARLVANINAVWLDVDYHDSPDPQSDTELGLAHVKVLAAQGEIPEPTLYHRSGRGFWVFWVLRQADGRALSPRGGNRAVWARLGRGIIECAERFGLPVDRNALTIERLTRMPESLNSRAKSKVVTTVSYGANHEPISYTLQELARLFNVPETPYLPLPPIVAGPRRIAPAPTTSGRGSSGQRALRERRIHDLDALISLRGGRFKEGCRNNAAWLFAALQRTHPNGAMLVSNFCRECCSPRLSPCEERAALKALKVRRFKITDLKFGELLGITEGEAMVLEGGVKYLQARLPFQAGAPTANRKRRRSLISQMYNVTGEPPTIPQIAERLRGAGCEASIGTIWNDIKALGLSNPRRHKPPFQERDFLREAPMRGDSPIYVNT